MWFQRLDIHDLRNLTAVRLDLAPGLNYFYGDNGAGKTAILEAVHLLARGRSFRSHQTLDLIRRGADEVRVVATVEDEHRGRQTLGIAKSRRNRTELRINGEPGRRLSEAALLLPLQVMVPSLSDLVFGSPVERRQWLDWGTFHVKPDYLRLLRSYLHALRQRNAALKAVAAKRLPEEGLGVWSEEVVGFAELVTSEREAYLEELRPLLMQAVAALMPGLELQMVYRRGWPEGSLRKVLSDSLAKELKSGSTHSGPHRADVELRISGMPAGASLSRGQGKALASAMMLSQSRLLMQTARRSSVFLIDDVGAELDVQHSERFFSMLSELDVQIMATSNSPPSQPLGGETAMFHVEHGKVVRQ
ncbi:MAG: DNA replication/repair protein RecF [Pseudomonadales bacterium]